MKKILYFICLVTALITLGINLYEHFVLTPIREKTFVISSVSVLTIYIVRPIFWTCIGGMIGFVILHMTHISYVGKKICGIGIGMIVAYCLLMILVLVVRFEAIDSIMFTTFIWLTQNESIFIIPGILIAVGVN